MAAYDNKVLDGAGVAKLSQLIKEEIASSSGGSGGGTTYTAGPGIEVDSNNVISHTTPRPSFLNVFLGLVSGTTYNASNNRSIVIPNESNYTKDQWKDILLDSGEALVMIDSSYAGPLTQAIAELENITTTKETILTFNLTTTMNSQYTYTISRMTAKPLNYWLRANQYYYIAYSPSGFGSSTTANSPRWLIIQDPFKQMASGYFQSVQGISATSIGGALDELATTRIPDALVSTETTPSTNNTINWLYE